LSRKTAAETAAGQLKIFSRNLLICGLISSNSKRHGRHRVQAFLTFRLYSATTSMLYTSTERFQTYHKCCSISQKHVNVF
jgi:hypothetical protein